PHGSRPLEVASQFLKCRHRRLITVGRVQPPLQVSRRRERQVRRTPVPIPRPETPRRTEQEPCESRMREHMRGDPNEHPGTGRSQWGPSSSRGDPARGARSAGQKIADPAVLGSGWGSGATPQCPCTAFRGARVHRPFTQPAADSGPSGRGGHHRRVGVYYGVRHEPLAGHLVPVPPAGDERSRYGWIMATKAKIADRKKRASGLDRDTLLRMYRTMVTARRIDDKE